MNTKHRILAFERYSKNVLGLSQRFENEVELNTFDGSFQYSIEGNFQDFIVKKRASNNASIVEHKLNSVCKEDLGLLDQQLTIKSQAAFSCIKELLKNTLDGEELSQELAKLIDLLKEGYPIPNLIEEDAIKIIFSDKNVKLAFEQLFELAILIKCEDELLKKLIYHLSDSIDGAIFIHNRNNVRIAQQLLAGYSALQEDFYIDVCRALNNHPKNFVISSVPLVLSVCRTKEEYKHSLQILNLDLDLQLFLNSRFLVETLNRSPIKINFLLSPSYLFDFFELETSDKSFKKLKYRTLFFLSDELWAMCTDVDRIELMLSFMRLADKDFNDVYKDIRRSERKILQVEHLSIFFEKIDLTALSKVKWIFLLSQISTNLEEHEKVAFCRKALITSGIPSINSEIGLSYANACGLKLLCHKVLNTTLMVGNFETCLPEKYDYDLTDIFENVLTLRKKHITYTDNRKVSVVLTTYNPNAEFLKMAIKSIEQQTHKNIELILVDDCSKEDISEKIKNIISSFLELKIIYLRNEVNVGQYVSRNIAIEAATGDYIAIQDDDDVSHCQRIEFQLDTLKKEHTVAVFTKHLRYSDSGRLSLDEPSKLILAGDGPATLLFEKSLCSAIGQFRNVRSRGDIDFRQRIESIVGSNRISYVNAPLYYMRSSLSSISSLFEYLHGDQLVYYRKQIELLSCISEQNQPVELNEKSSS